MFQNVKHLVVDSGAFIKNSAVHEYAENIYSVNGVVTEIRDKAIRQRLQVLPYTLQLKDPDPENFKYVAEFSKKTGDYASLSATDLKIIALTYQLQKELVGTEHLNEEPSCEVTNKRASNQQLLHGFFYPENEEDDVTNDEAFSEKSSVSDECCQNIDAHNLQQIESYNRNENGPCDDVSSADSIPLNSNQTLNNDVSDKKIAEDCNKENGQGHNRDVEDCDREKDDDHNRENENCDKENEDHNREDVEDCDKENIEDRSKENWEEADKENLSEEDKDEYISTVENDDDSWITPDNLEEIQRKMGNLSVDSNSNTLVACITTDFAIQNVLLQMGLNVVSVNGMLIKHAKVFILRCFACFRTTSIMTSKFCSNCGNKTLKRVAVSVNDDGTKTVHINFRRPINIRGTKYSLPKPQGGKHAQNPHLCPDQPFPHNRPSKAFLQKFDVLSLDYCEASSSPFAVHDIYSRAANLGIRRSSQQKYGRRNPNEWNKRTGNKKNKK